MHSYKPTRVGGRRMSNIHHHSTFEAWSAMWSWPSFIKAWVDLVYFVVYHSEHQRLQNLRLLANAYFLCYITKQRVKQFTPPSSHLDNHIVHHQQLHIWMLHCPTRKCTEIHHKHNCKWWLWSVPFYHYLSKYPNHSFIKMFFFLKYERGLWLLVVSKDQ